MLSTTLLSHTVWV